MLTCRVKSGAAPRMCAAATLLLAISLSSGCGWDAPSAAGAATEDAARPSAVTVLAQRDAQPGWAVPYGGEFWRRRAPERDPAVGAPGATVSTGTAIGDVVDRASHALERAPPGEFPHANSATFAVALDGRGLRFTPYRPGVEGASQLAAHVPPPRPGAAPGTPPALLAHGPAERMLGRAVPDPGVAATIRTTRMTLGDRTIPAASSWSVYGNTAQAALDPAGTIVEHQEIRGDGVELAWLLREPPPAGAAWTVELGVEGLDFRGETAAGVHYADAGGTARVVIGAAVLVDTTGKRWPIATELQGGQPRWTVPADVLASARFPVALDPAVGPEFGIDVAVPGYGSTQGLGGLAWNGSSYLIVWEDNRTATGTIFGARADAAGTVLDPLGVRLSPPTGY
ncbi:MAG: hypothetical protein H7269_02750, partial [Cellulomonas sp.]|nr:hypothetical protein [Cellulomonas sp.]